MVPGIGCQDGEPQTTCNPDKIGGQPATPTDDTCTASLPAGTTDPQLTAFTTQCNTITGSKLSGDAATGFTCTFDATQTCPPPEGSTQTPTVVNGRCTIQPGET